ncbi:hypothetical protein E2C01_022258 [Portunus trituberculatus]|uniref:Uncharacterized protein n=1 Tax=Portunus trituberculatus TaxID=210409 RepID=A0A5B7E4Y3_PORTR|nr:hypothetical protein [Portunus trituberculatus]
MTTCIDTTMHKLGKETKNPSTCLCNPELFTKHNSKQQTYQLFSSTTGINWFTTACYPDSLTITEQPLLSRKANPGLPRHTVLLILIDPNLQSHTNMISRLSQPNNNEFKPYCSNCNKTKSENTKLSTKNL